MLLVTIEMAYLYRRHFHDIQYSAYN